MQFFYMPLALAVPPTQYLVHKQFNLLYQFWIHTEVGVAYIIVGVAIYYDIRLLTSWVHWSIY